MRKITFTILLLFLSTFYIYAQEQFENPGFEDWEAITDQFSEPVNWSTIKTCIPENIAAFAPVPISKETENVHSGSAAVHLITMGTIAGSANGMITNGRVFASINIQEGYIFIDPTDERWNMKITHRPDSVAGWFRCNPMNNDFGVMKVVLSLDSTALPATDSSNWVAFGKHEFPSEPVTEWTRFSFPLEYYNNKMPQYCLTVLTSSEGFNAVEGSEIWFDDIELIYNPNNAISEISENDFNIYNIGKQLFVYIKSPKRQMLSLNIFNIQGKVMLKDFVYTNQKENINLKVNDGVYIAVFTSEKGKQFSKKIVIKNN